MAPLKSVDGMFSRLKTVKTESQGKAEIRQKDKYKWPLTKKYTPVKVTKNSPVKYTHQRHKS